MKTIIFLLFFLQSFSLIYSQNFWNEIPSPTGGKINEIKFVNDSILVAYNDKAIYFCNRDDYKWKARIIDSINGENIYLDKIFSCDVSNNVLYVSIEFANGCLVFNGIIYSKDFGETWGLINVNQLFTNVIVSDNVFFLGNEKGLFVSYDSCKTFDGANLIGNKVIDIAKSQNGDVWALIQNAGLFQYLTDSHKWKFISTIDFPANSIFVDKNNIYISSNSKMHISTDEGVFWKIENIGNYQINSFTSDFDGNNYLCTEKNGILLSTDNRKNWSKINNGLSAYKFTAIEYLPSKELIVSTKKNGIYKSSDNGKSWYNISNSVTGIIKFYINKNNYIYGLSSNYLYYTTNNGESWKNIHTPGISQIAFTKNNDIYGLVPSFGLYKLQNENQWIKVNVEGRPAELLSSLTITKKDKIIIGTFNNLCCSDDYGKTWSTINFSGNPAAISHLRTNKNNSVIAISDAGIIYYSQNGGSPATWNSIFSFFNIVRSCEYTDDNKIFFSWFTDFGNIFGVNYIKIKDYFVENHSINTGLKSLLVNDFTFDKEGYVYSCTSEGIYKSNEVVLGLKENFQPQLSLDVSVYPIPCNDIMNIKIRNSINDRYSISLINLYGNTVRNIIQNTFYPQGEINIKANLTGIANGVYFLHINNSKSVLNYKVIKMNE